MYCLLVRSGVVCLRLYCNDNVAYLMLSISCLKRVGEERNRGMWKERERNVERKREECSGERGMCAAHCGRLIQGAPKILIRTCCCTPPYRMTLLVPQLPYNQCHASREHVAGTTARATWLVLR